jgi:hypothetical protein
VWVIVNQDDAFVRLERPLERLVFVDARSSSVRKPNYASVAVDRYKLFVRRQVRQRRRDSHHDLQTPQEFVDGQDTWRQPLQGLLDQSAQAAR